MRPEWRFGVDLAEELVAIRSQVAAIAPQVSPVAFDNSPEAVGSWLSEAAHAAKTKNYLFAQLTDPPVQTIYVEMNDFVFNTDRWMLSAFGFGQRTSDEAVSVSEWFDALVGEELGDVQVPEFRLTGMEATQQWFEVNGRHAEVEVARPVEELVRLSLFELLDRGLEYAVGFNMRLAAARHEEPRISVWEPTGLGSFRRSMHDEDAR